MGEEELLNGVSKSLMVEVTEEQLRMIKSPLGTELKQFPNATMWLEMVKEMECSGCDRFPNPNFRFLCPNGHVYCFDCGTKLKKQEGGICLADVDEERFLADDSEPEDGKVKNDEGEESIGEEPGWINAESDDEDGHGNDMLRCGKEITRVLNDPIYNSFFNSIKWRCPKFFDSNVKCKEVCGGEDLLKHFAECHVSKCNNEGCLSK